MRNKILVLILLFIGISITAQTTISGYVDIDEKALRASDEIYLSKISIEDMMRYEKANKIASTTPDKNGFFNFKEDLLSDKDAMYRLHIERFEKALKDTLQVGQLFLLSNRDSIQFEKSEIPFATYSTSNLADKEWQKLLRFERQLLNTDFKKEDSLSKAYIGGLKAYTKDSLKILMVKLIGIKQLDNKDLLEKDIAKNTDYYLVLLKELKESDIERSEYLFLENKLAFLTTEVAENKYAISKLINILLGLSVLFLVFFAFRTLSKKKHVAVVDLSRQEKNIKGLILQGKSNKEIAGELFISLSTVKTHITNIYSKLQVSNRQELLQKTQN